MFSVNKAQIKVSNFIPNLNELSNKLSNDHHKFQRSFFSFGIAILSKEVKFKISNL